MKCNHDVEHLVGSQDGIFCRNCGRTFANFSEIEKDRDGLKSDAKTDIPKEDGEADKVIEKPKKTAVPAKDSTAKTAKTTKKKTVSK